MGDHHADSLIYAYDPPPPAGTVVVDASYGSDAVNLNEDRRALGRTVERGAWILPCPAMGRGPEIALYLFKTFGLRPILDDDTRNAIRDMVVDHPAVVRRGALPWLERLLRESKPLSSRISGVAVAHNAIATAGAARQLVESHLQGRQTGICFTGFVPSNAPAYTLLNEGRAVFSQWPVHPSLEDLTALAIRVSARVVIPAFGDMNNGSAWRDAFGRQRVVLGSTCSLG
jgi:hypothetical protein